MEAATTLFDFRQRTSAALLLLFCLVVLTFSPVGGASWTGTSPELELCNWAWFKALCPDGVSILNIRYQLVSVIRLYLREELHIFPLKDFHSSAVRSVLMQLTVPARTSCQKTALILSALIKISTWNTESWFCFFMWTVRYIAAATPISRLILSKTIIIFHK